MLFAPSTLMSFFEILKAVTLQVGRYKQQDNTRLSSQPVTPFLSLGH